MKGTGIPFNSLSPKLQALVRAADRSAGRAEKGDRPRILDRVAEIPVQAEPAAPKSPYRSKLEALFHVELRSRGYDYCEYEPLRLKLAARAHYTPDFVTRFNFGGGNPALITCWEVKGHWREAARVRIKVAARLFPWMRFIAVTKQRKKNGGAWVEEEFFAPA